MRHTTILFFLSLVMALCALGGTRIRDTLHDARGNRAEGTCTVQWPAFTTAGGTAIAAGTRQVRIRTGVLDVELEPTAGASPLGSVYTVRCTFADSVPSPPERWAVPASEIPVGLSEIRVNPSLPPVGVRVAIGDVEGLTTQLSVRPVKGAGWETGRAALIDESGALAGVEGDSTDCVRVDGSSAPCAEDASFAALSGDPEDNGALAEALAGKAPSGHTHDINALLPSQEGQAGRVLRSDGSAASWQTGGQLQHVTPGAGGVSLHFTLGQTPVGTPVCYLNGLRLAESVDYERTDGNLYFAGLYFVLFSEGGYQLVCDANF